MSAPDATEHLALNVYRWGEAAQNRLAAACLGPAMRRLRAEGAVRHFFITRFDARGPHLVALIGVAPGRAGEVTRVLGGAVARHLAADPCTTVLTQAELAERHDDCRGAVLSTIDAEPGFAPNDSWRVAPHPADGPFLVATAPVAEQGELWALLSELALWSIERVHAGEGGAAGRQWIAAMDGALHQAGAPAREWWRWYATTLLMGLADRLGDDDEPFVRRIPALIGEKNLAAVRRAWDPGAAAVRWPGIHRLARIIAADDGRSDAERRKLFRIVNHFVMGQLGYPVRLRIPLVLYAWYQAHSLTAAVA